MNIYFKTLMSEVSVQCPRSFQLDAVEDIFRSITAVHSVRTASAESLHSCRGYLLNTYFKTVMFEERPSSVRAVCAQFPCRQLLHIFHD